MTDEAKLPHLAYRSQRHDDWGTVRSLDGEPILVVRIPRGLTDDDLDGLRARKADPCEERARAIIHTINSALDARAAPDEVEAVADTLDRIGTFHNWWTARGPWRDLDPIGKQEFLDCSAEIATAAKIKVAADAERMAEALSALRGARTLIDTLPSPDMSSQLRTAVDARIAAIDAVLSGKPSTGAIAEAVVAEREACAAIATTLHQQPGWDHGHQAAERYGAAVAAAIRARQTGASS